MGYLGALQHWLWAIPSPKCHSLWVAALTFNEHRAEGASSCPQRTTFEALRSSKPPQLTPWVLRPRLRCMRQRHRRRWTSSGLEARLLSHKVLCLRKLGQPCFWPLVGRLQASTDQEDASSGADPMGGLLNACKRGSLFARSHPRCAHSASKAACPHLSHPVWETKQLTHFSLQHHFQGTFSLVQFKLKSEHHHIHYS